MFFDKISFHIFCPILSFCNLIHLILIPPVSQGVGKGTYSKRVAQALGFSHIAAGDLVRDEIKARSSLGIKMQDVVKSGQLLSDDLILQVLRIHYFHLQVL